jgi:hypothetical protein
MVKVTRDQSGQLLTSWVEHDGHGHSRKFCSEIEALRYAMQVKCRLEIDAYNRELQLLAIATFIPANDNSSGRRMNCG